MMASGTRTIPKIAITRRSLEAQTCPNYKYRISQDSNSSLNDSDINHRWSEANLYKSHAKNLHTKSSRNQQDHNKKKNSVLVNQQDKATSADTAHHISVTRRNQANCQVCISGDGSSDLKNDLRKITPVRKKTYEINQSKPHLKSRVTRSKSFLSVLSLHSSNSDNKKSDRQNSPYPSCIKKEEGKVLKRQNSFPLHADQSQNRYSSLRGNSQSSKHYINGVLAKLPEDSHSYIHDWLMKSSDFDTIHHVALTGRNARRIKKTGTHGEVYTVPSSYFPDSEETMNNKRNTYGFERGLQYMSSQRSQSAKKSHTKRYEGDQQTRIGSGYWKAIRLTPGELDLMKNSVYVPPSKKLPFARRPHYRVSSSSVHYNSNLNNSLDHMKKKSPRMQTESQSEDDAQFEDPDRLKLSSIIGMAERKIQSEKAESKLVAAMENFETSRNLHDYALSKQLQKPIAFGLVPKRKSFSRHSRQYSGSATSSVKGMVNSQFTVLDKPIKIYPEVKHTMNGYSSDVKFNRNLRIKELGKDDDADLTESSKSSAQSNGSRQQIDKKQVKALRSKTYVMKLPGSAQLATLKETKSGPSTDSSYDSLPSPKLAELEKYLTPREWVKLIHRNSNKTYPDQSENNANHQTENENSKKPQENTDSCKDISDKYKHDLKTATSIGKWIEDMRPTLVPCNTPMGCEEEASIGYASLSEGEMPQLSEIAAVQIANIPKPEGLHNINDNLPPPPKPVLKLMVVLPSKDGSSSPDGSIVS